MRIQELAAALQLSFRDGVNGSADVWVKVARTALDELNGREVVSAILDVQADGTIVEIRAPSMSSESHRIEEVCMSMLTEIQRLLNTHMHEQAAALVNGYCMLRAESGR